MPLTECPDCGGVLSDQALICPTCHRVMKSVTGGGPTMVMLCGRWALVGAIAIVVIWAVVQLLT